MAQHQLYKAGLYGDNALANGGNGEILQLESLGLSDVQLSNLTSIKFTNLTNLTLWSLATPGTPTSTATQITSWATTDLTWADIKNGRYFIKYSQTDQAANGEYAVGTFTVTPSSGISYTQSLDLAISTSTGAAVWGDESGFGSNKANNGGSVAGAGAGGADISQLLQDYTSGTSNLNQWVTVVNNQSGSTLPGVISGSFDATQTGALITIDVDGPGSGAVAQRIFLEGVTFNTTDPIQLRTNGVIVA